MSEDLVMRRNLVIDRITLNYLIASWTDNILPHFLCAILDRTVQLEKNDNRIILDVAISYEEANLLKALDKNITTCFID